MSKRSEVKLTTINAKHVEETCEANQLQHAEICGMNMLMRDTKRQPNCVIANQEPSSVRRKVRILFGHNMTFLRMMRIKITLEFFWCVSKIVDSRMVIEI